MPAYRAMRKNFSALDFFTQPETMTQVALNAQRILGVDAAILFADLLPMLIPMGLELDYVEGLGPHIANPIRTPADVALLHPVEATEQLAYAAEAVTATRRGLPRNIPLIGFAGGPFTLASYAIEGQSSRHYLHVKRLMHDAPDAWDRLLHKLVAAIRDYVDLQIDAGVQAVQLFDSWIGCLSVADFRTHVMPHTKALIQQLRGRVPLIFFGVGNTHLLPDVHRLQPDVLALDWRTPLTETWEQLSCQAVQGNLDPALLCAGWPSVESHARSLLDEVAGRPGHIFNLGHGILPQTPIDNVRRLVDFVHSYSSR